MFRPDKVSTTAMSEVHGYFILSCLLRLSSALGPLNCLYVVALTAKRSRRARLTIGLIAGVPSIIVQGDDVEVSFLVAHPIDD
jgi:hypothetical protein